MPTLEYLIKQLSTYLTEPRPVSQRVITSKHFTGWVRDRLQKDQQILLNAIICREGGMQERLRTIIFQIEKEFETIAPAKVLPFPCDDPSDLPALVNGLLDHFKSPLTAEDVIQKVNSSHTFAGGYIGYIIITILQEGVIV